MNITITADSLDSIRHQVGSNGPHVDIAIKWRCYGYGRNHKPGCIITFPTGEVPVCFESGREAGDAIRKYLMQHDKWVRQGCPELTV